MLAIGRALMGRPRCLMLDEPSLGIAPILVETIFTRLVALNKERGLTLLLVEQNASLALRVSDYAYVLETGHIQLEGPSAELKNRPEVRAAYLGH
jgi:branched-chain amino acid transport system ATP-binding protein